MTNATLTILDLDALTTVIGGQAADQAQVQKKGPPPGEGWKKVSKTQSVRDAMQAFIKDKTGSPSGTAPYDRGESYCEEGDDPDCWYR